MSWFATSCCSLVAGFILYRLLIAHGHMSATREPYSETKTARGIPTPLRVKTDSPAFTALSHEMAKEKSSEPRREEEPSSKEKESGQKAETTKLDMLPPQIPDPSPRVRTAPAHSAHGLEALPSRTSSPPRLKPPTFGASLMPAPPRPNPSGNGGGVSLSLRPPPSAAASLRVPPTKVLSNASMAPTSSIMPPGKQVSRKVILEPGHSPLDWAALASNPNSRLRGKDAPPGDSLLRVTSTRLKQQNGRKGRDAWTVYQGKVYNITPYVAFHPGGKGEILRGAGKDSDKLFMEAHPWVNWDGMLSECLVGILVGDTDDVDSRSGGLDDMD